MQVEVVHQKTPTIPQQQLKQKLRTYLETLDVGRGGFSGYVKDGQPSLGNEVIDNTVSS